MGTGLSGLSGQGWQRADHPVGRRHQGATAGGHRASEGNVCGIQGTKIRRKATKQELTGMALTRDFKQTVVERVRRDPAFARAMLDEAATLFLSDEPRTARLILRDLVNATIGFEGLATTTAMPAKSLHRKIPRNNNPHTDNSDAIFCFNNKKL